MPSCQYIRDWILDVDAASRQAASPQFRLQRRLKRRRSAIDDSLVEPTAPDRRVSFQRRLFSSSPLREPPLTATPLRTPLSARQANITAPIATHPSRDPSGAKTHLMTQPSRPQRVPMSAPRTPNLRTSGKRPATAFDGPEDDEADTTPRPLKTLAYVPDVSLPSAESSYASSSWTSTSGSKRRRSASPKKSILTTGVDQFEFLVFNHHQTKLPHSLKAVVADLEDFSLGLAVIPLSLQSYLLGDRNESLLAENRIIARQTFYDSSPRRSSFGEPLDVPQVLEIVRQTSRCTSMSHSEPSWNCRVHFPILDLALSRSAFASSLEVEVMTTAMIESKTLCPLSFSQSHTLRRIDFAVVLQENAERTAALDSQAIQGCNQSDYAPIRRCPLAINIETKLKGEGYEAAVTQLSVWVFAQFAKLRRMFGFVPDFLPLLLVQGDEWKFLAASQNPSTGRDDRRDYTTYIWDSVILGSTSSPVGVWKICAALQYLMAWSVETYDVWLTQQLHMPPHSTDAVATAG